MKSGKDYLIGFLLLTSLGGVIFAWRQYGELSDLRAAALNRDERADFQKRIWDLERTNQNLSARAGGQPGANGGPGGNGGRGPGPGGFDGRGGRGGGPRGNPLQQLDAFRNVMSKPEVQALITTQQRARVDQQYGALFKNLNLPPDQLEKFKTLLADRANTMLDVLSVARDQGIDPRADPEGFKKLFADTQADFNSSVKAAIGDSGFSQYQSYEATAPQRNTVSELQQRLSYTDTSLTQAQCDQLTQILAANPAPQAARPNAGNGGPPDGPPGGGGGGPGPGGMGGPGLGGPGGAGDLAGMMLGSVGGGAVGIGPGGNGGSATVTTAAVSQASSVLSQPQVAALQQIQQLQQTQSQLQQIVRDTLGPQRPPPQSGGGKD